MDKKIIVFIFDFGPHIGQGHLMRCLSLVEFFKKKKISSFFFNFKKRKINKIFLKKYNLNYLPNLSFKKKIDATLIIDDYSISENQINYFRNKFSKIVIIDDEGLKKINAHIIINNNLGAVKKNYKLSIYKKIYIGPKYALVRKDIKDLETRRIPLKNHILINFGAGNVYSRVKKVIQIFLSSLQLQKKNYSIYIFVRLNKNNKSILLKRFKDLKIKFFEPGNHYLKIVRRCDYAIVSPSVSFLELASIGVPCIIYQTSKNQEKNFNYINKSKIGNSYNNIDDLNLDINNCIRKYSNEIFKKKLSLKLKKKINVNGANLLGSAILKYNNSY